jgi:CRISPR/Cas system-associated exonuclease Cas4 (RecB family)
MTNLNDNCNSPSENFDGLICEHMSVSRKQTWTECPAKYKYRYHLKIIPDVPEQPYFVYGKLVHKIAEIYVKEKGERKIEDITADCLTGKIELEEGKSPPVLSQEYKTKLTSHIRFIKQISDKIGYDGHLEYPFHYDLDPPKNYFVKGFIDRLIIRGDKFFILDYKTTKKGFWRKNSNTIRKDLQLRFYARVVQKEFNAKPENIQAALYYLEGSELVATKFNEQMLITAEEELYNAFKEIINTKPDDVWGRVGDQCKRCDYRKICSFYSLT